MAVITNGYSVYSSSGLTMGVTRMTSTSKKTKARLNIRLLIANGSIWGKRQIGSKIHVR